MSDPANPCAGQTSPIKYLEALDICRYAQLEVILDVKDLREN